MLTASTEDGIDVVSVEHGGVREIFATALPDALEDLSSLHHRVRRVLDDSEGEVLEMRVFGSTDAFASCAEIIRELHGDIDWPLVYVQGEGCFDGEVAGLQVHAVAGTAVETIRRDGWPS